MRSSFVFVSLSRFVAQSGWLKELHGDREMATAQASSSITAVGGASDYAELQLGEALPAAGVKWTKDARLLYRTGKEKRRKKTRKGSGLRAYERYRGLALTESAGSKEAEP
jgi:hypothetical protein